MQGALTLAQAVSMIDSPPKKILGHFCPQSSHQTVLSGYGLAGCVDSDGGRLQGQRRHCRLYSLLRDWFTATELPQTPVQESNHSWNCVYFTPRSSISFRFFGREKSQLFSVSLGAPPLPPAPIQEHSLSSYVVIHAGILNQQICFATVATEIIFS